MYDEFKTLLEQDKIEDMSRLYCLVKKTENHRNRADEESILDPMRKSFQDHIATQGQSYESIFIRVHIFQGRILEADFIIYFLSLSRVKKLSEKLKILQQPIQNLMLIQSLTFIVNITHL